MNVYDAAQHLATNDSGRVAMSHLLAWLRADGGSLDAENQQACLALLRAAWNGREGSAREAMREALREASAH